MAKKTTYSSDYCEMLIEHGKKGLSFETFAAKIGVSRQTIYSWEKKYKEFADAKKVALEHRKLLIEQMIIAIATGKIKGNAACAIFAAKNILKWSDNIEEDTNNDKVIRLIYNLDNPKLLIDNKKGDVENE